MNHDGPWDYIDIVSANEIIFKCGLCKKLFKELPQEKDTVLEDHVEECSAIPKCETSPISKFVL